MKFTFLTNEDEKRIIDAASQNTGSGSGSGSGSGGVSSWNDLTDKPFYEEAWTIKWDGSIEGKESASVADGQFYLYKIGDISKVDDLVGATITNTVGGVTETFVYDGSVTIAQGDMSMIDIGNELYLYVVGATSITADGITVEFPSTGLYTMDFLSQGASDISLTIDGGSIHKLDPKYLPEGVGYEEDVPDTEIFPLQELDGYYSTINIPAVELEEGLEYIVTFNGVEYKCTAQTVYAMDENDDIHPAGWLLGNGMIGPEGKYGVTGNDEPFYIMSYLYDGEIESKIYVDGTDASAYPTLSIVRLAHTATRKINDKYLPEVVMNDYHAIDWDGTETNTYVSTTIDELTFTYYWVCDSSKAPKYTDLFNAIGTLHQPNGELVSEKFPAEAFTVFDGGYKCYPVFYVIKDASYRLPVEVDGMSFIMSGVYFPKISNGSWLTRIEYYTSTSYGIGDATNRMAGEIGILPDLKTTEKSDLVKAINEVHTKTPIWNELFDTPFDKQDSTGTYEWDGTYSTDTDAYFSAGITTWVRVSNRIPINFKVNSILQSYTNASGTSENEVAINESRIVYGDGAINYADYVMVVYDENFTVDGTSYTAPTTGVYVKRMVYNSINVFVKSVSYSYTKATLREDCSTKLPAIPDVSAAPTAEDFNTLLAALRNAGLMAT